MKPEEQTEEYWINVTQTQLGKLENEIISGKEALACTILKLRGKEVDPAKVENLVTNNGLMDLVWKYGYEEYKRGYDTAMETVYPRTK